jgi:hypothetical protein
MKAVVAVAPAGLAPAAHSLDLLCVLFQIIELRNARLEGSDTAFVRVQIDKVAQVGNLFFFETRQVRTGSWRLAKAVVASVFQELSVLLLLVLRATKASFLKSLRPAGNWTEQGAI